MAPIFSSAAAAFATEPAVRDAVRFGAVDCDASTELCAKRFGVHQFPTVYAFLAPVAGGSPSRATAEELEGVVGSRSAKLRRLIHQVREKAESLGVATQGVWANGVKHIAPMAPEEEGARPPRGGREREEEERGRVRGGGPHIHRVDIAAAVLYGLQRGVFVGVTRLRGVRKAALEAWLSLLAIRCFFFVFFWRRGSLCWR